MKKQFLFCVFFLQRLSFFCRKWTLRPKNLVKLGKKTVKKMFKMLYIFFGVISRANALK